MTTTDPDTPESGPAVPRDGLSAPSVGNHPAATGEAGHSPPHPPSRALPRVYLTGPIKSLPPEEYTDRFSRAEAYAISQGWNPVNPLKVPPCDDESCESTEPRFADGSYQHSWQCYLRYDLIALLRCDAVLVLPGWEVSKGVDLEVKTGLAVGMPWAFLSADFDCHSEWYRT